MVGAAWLRIGGGKTETCKRGAFRPPLAPSRLRTHAYWHIAEKRKEKGGVYPAKRD